MNNEICLAEKICDDIYNKNKERQLLPYCIYLWNRLSPIGYDFTAKEADDDPFSIRTAFRAKGENSFKKGTISNAGFVSLFLSATTYSIFTKKHTTFHGFRPPDIFPYITKKGMSYKVVSGYEVNKI